jgi:hypothetical protein
MPNTSVLFNKKAKDFLETSPKTLIFFVVLSRTDYLAIHGMKTDCGSKYATVPAHKVVGRMERGLEMVWSLSNNSGFSPNYPTTDQEFSFKK